MALPIVPTACSSVDPHGLILKEGERERRERRTSVGRKEEREEGGREGRRNREKREELESEGRRRGRRREGKRGGIEKRREGLPVDEKEQGMYTGEREIKQQQDITKSSVVVLNARWLLHAVALEHVGVKELSAFK